MQFKSRKMREKERKATRPPRQPSTRLQKGDALKETSRKALQNGEKGITATFRGVFCLFQIN